MNNNFPISANSTMQTEHGGVSHWRGEKTKHRKIQTSETPTILQRQRLSSVASFRRCQLKLKNWISTSKTHIPFISFLEMVEDFQSIHHAGGLLTFNFFSSNNQVWWALKRWSLCRTTQFQATDHATYSTCNPSCYVLFASQAGLRKGA